MPIILYFADPRVRVIPIKQLYGQGQATAPRVRSLNLRSYNSNLPPSNGKLSGGWEFHNPPERLNIPNMALHITRATEQRA